MSGWDAAISIRKRPFPIPISICSGCADGKTDCQVPFCTFGFWMQYSLFAIASSAPGIFRNLIKDRTFLNMILIDKKSCHLHRNYFTIKTRKKVELFKKVLMKLSGKEVACIFFTLYTDTRIKERKRG